MSHAQRTVISPARWTTTHTPMPKHPRRLEDTKPERALRRILESLSRELIVNFSSQDRRYDFWIQGVPIDVQGPYHAKQKQRDHDAYKASEAIKDGVPAPILIEACAVLKYPDLVRDLLRTIAVLHGATIKEPT